MAGRLILHIGRNKAGSTSLQTLWLNDLDRLRAAGIDYVLFGQPDPAGHDLVSVASHMALADLVRDRASGSILVSHEGLCCFHPDFAGAMAADLAELDVTILYWVRGYREWAVSNYLFDVLIGRQSADFDAYLDALGDAVSCWPALRIWADAVGWDRLRVRSLHPDDLVGGDLAADGMAAIGLGGDGVGPRPRANAAPAWISTELIRYLLGTESRRTGLPDQAELAVVLGIGETVDGQVTIAAAERGLALDRGAYLTADQAMRLRDAYNRDLDLLARHGGPRLRHDDGGDIVARSFLPSARRVSADLLQDLRPRIAMALAGKGLLSAPVARRLDDLAL